MFFNIIVVLFYLRVISCIDFSDNVEVNTTSGLVRGLAIRVLNTSIDQFLGIPYAQPPTGGLRFAKPQPIEKPLEGIIDGTTPKHSCMQLIPGQSIEPLDGLTLSEDCLVLNLWAPNGSQLKPVMFWIYGGSFSRGSIFMLQSFNGSAIAAHDVVVVTVNYRTGPFGFLYDNESIAGNQGLYDQLLALKWVRENIHLFGGDKDQITIFGESAGSFSVSAHILSPLTRGLFKRAIMQSGSFYRNKNRGSLTKSEAVKQAKQLAKSVNCSDDNQWLECLRRVDAKILVNFTQAITVPIDEGTEYLPISAQKAFLTNDYNSDIELMTGNTLNEGAIQNLNHMTVNGFKFLVNSMDSVFHDLNVENITEFYLRDVNTNSSDAIKWAYFDFWGDLFMKCPTYLFAKQYAKHTPDKGVYVYELTYMTKNMAKIGCRDNTTGICHSADVELVFGRPVREPNEYTNDDKNISEDMMKLWTNFAKTGKPNTDWPKLNPNSVAKVKDLNPFKTNHYLNDPFINCDTFWDKYYN